jgi:pSer/pThr/pTyr-binding forkhead associated (FHA) protein
MPLNAKLVVVGGDVKTAEIKLRLPSTIGRGRGTTIMLPHPLVSRQHCELFEADGHLMVRDLGSLNGTFVNNQRVTEAPLPPNELLTIGTVTFRAVYDPATTADGNAPQAKAAQHRAGANGTLATTLVDPAKRTEAPAAEPDDDDGDFDFDKPLMPVEEDDMPVRQTKPAAPKSPPPPSSEKGTTRYETTLAESTGPDVTTKPMADPPAAESKLPAADDDDEETANPGEDDEDFGDFLKSLGK